MNKYAAILMMALLTALSCSAIRRNVPDGPVENSVILSGAHSLVDSFQVNIITGKSEWEQVWHRTMGGVEPLPKIPTVDFGRQYVIAAFMGQRTSSGYRIEIPSIVKKGRTLMVTVKKYETPGMLPVVTNPFTLVRIPKGNYKLQVIEETTQ